MDLVKEYVHFHKQPIFQPLCLLESIAVLVGFVHKIASLNSQNGS